MQRIPEEQLFLKDATLCFVKNICMRLMIILDAFIYGPDLNIFDFNLNSLHKLLQKTCNGLETLHSTKN